jgi:hypothetical protein
LKIRQTVNDEQENDSNKSFSKKKGHISGHLACEKMLSISHQENAN